MTALIARIRAASPVRIGQRLLVMLALAFALVTPTVRGVVDSSAANVFDAMSALTFGGLVLLAGPGYARAMSREHIAPPRE